MRSEALQRAGELAQLPVTSPHFIKEAVLQSMMVPLDHGMLARVDKRTARFGSP